MSANTETVIIGAGPYGLSIAAHLRSQNTEHRVFGEPLHTWRTAMPKGMMLKSDGFASNLSVPAPDSTLEDFCRARELPYHPTDVPVPADTFVEYGLDFQRRFVPQLESGTVVDVVPRTGGYHVMLGDGTAVDTHQVVVAAGITHFATTPPIFHGLPSSLVTHASAHHDVGSFAGRDVTVIGAGATAVELAVALAAAGAHPRLVVRAPVVKFAGAPAERSLASRVRHPSSGLGPGIRSRLCCDVPDLFRVIPTRQRAEIVRRHLGPSSPWHLRRNFESSVEVLTSRSVEHVAVIDDQLKLELGGESATAPSVIKTDHVICATGYRPDLDRLTFLDADLRAQIRTINGAPRLDAHFQSSAPGLLFAGISAAMTFGPLMRFMYGDEFAARRIAKRLAKRD